MVNQIARIQQFIRNRLWRMSLKDIPAWKANFIRFLRLIVFAARNFTDDNCSLRASALTFYSLLSVVPVLALAFGISKGFGFEKMLEAKLFEALPGQNEVVGRIIDFAHTLLQNTQGGLLAGVGIALLFWTVIKLLGNIERSFNDIWKVKTDRSFVRKFSDYLSLMLVGPVLVILSSSLTVFISTQVEEISHKVALVGYFSPLIFFMMNYVPFLLAWILFTFLYSFMPNTDVKLYSATFAGFIAGTAYQLTQSLYIKFQVGVANYNAIYGSFAALPLFLAWLQISWLIVLLGAEISHSIQDVSSFESTTHFKFMSFSLKKLLALHIVHLAVRQFLAGKPPMTAVQLADLLEIPGRLVNMLLRELIESGLVAEIAPEAGSEPTYLPARDPAGLTIHSVIEAMENRGTDTLNPAKREPMESLNRAMEDFKRAIIASPTNRTLGSIDT
jgi:membrane protein